MRHPPHKPPTHPPKSHNDQITVPLAEEEQVKPSSSRKLNLAEGDKSTGQMGFYHSAGNTNKLFVEHNATKQRLKMNSL